MKARCENLWCSRHDSFCRLVSEFVPVVESFIQPAASNPKRTEASWMPCYRRCGNFDWNANVCIFPVCLPTALIKLS